MALKGRFVPKFPARVLGGTAISVTKSSGVYTFTLDISSLTEQSSFTSAERDNIFLVGYDSDNSHFRKFDLDTLLTTISAGLDATLVAIAGLTGAANKAIYFTGTDVAALYDLSAGGRALANTTAAADKVPYYTSASEATTADLTSFARTILDDANAGAARTTLGLVIGTDVQAYDAGLADIAALAVTDGNIIVGDGTNWVAESGATARTSLGLGTGNSPQFTGIELGHASDTTITRVSAGVIAVEGSNVLLASGLGSITQAYDAELAALAGLTSAADKVPYFTGSGTAAVADFTAAGRSMVAAASAAAQTALLSNFTGDSGSGGVKGLVPAPASGDAAASKFLSADGSWNVPSGAGDVTGPASSTDNAAARFDGVGGKTLQNSALIIADTTGALSRSGGGGIPVQGTNTNDSAAAGDVGEVQTESVVLGSAVSLTTATPANVTSKALTAGEWIVFGAMTFNPNAATNVTALNASLNTTSATSSLVPGQRWRQTFPGGSVLGGVYGGAMIGPFRISTTGTPTVYLVAEADFTVNTLAAYGILYAWRVR